MERRAVAVLVLLVVALALVGCVGTRTRSTYIGTSYDPQLVSKIEVGETTREEILDLFGHEYIQEEDPNVIRYERVETRVERRIYGAYITTTYHGVRIRFDDEGVVSDYDVLGQTR
jgi:outer membrane protein assembly factor BamE (lipoprotein component of BamABCDE complex)